VSTWSAQWLSQLTENSKNFGAFKDNGIGKLFKQNYAKPCIVVGSGPTLKENGPFLDNTHGISVVSCLHNFHYFVDNNLRCDYFVTLDAGEITVEEISEGGKETAEFYAEATKDYTLIAFIGTHPKLLNLWKGKI
jgi:hypothetical protein